MELRHLRFVNAVIEAGSFARAAVDLGITQPALTKAIQRLEQELTLSLFERTGRGTRPTPYALVLQRFAHVAESGLGQALSEIHDLRYNTRNELRVGVTQLLGSCLLPPAVAVLLRDVPDARINVVARPGGLPRSVADHEVDIAVLPLAGETRASRFEQHHLFNDRFVVICRPDHPLRKSKAIQPKDLVRYKWIYGDAPSLHRQHLGRFFSDAGLSLPGSSIECRAPAIVKAIVARTDHLGIVTRMGVLQDLAAKELAVVDICTPFMSRPIGVIWSSDRQLSAVALAMIRALEAASAPFA